MNQIFETEHSLAILDAFPTAPGHSLLISKAPVATVMELNEQQAADVLKELPRLCRAVQLVTSNSTGEAVQGMLQTIHQLQPFVLSNLCLLVRVFPELLGFSGNQLRRRERSPQRRSGGGPNRAPFAFSRLTSFFRRRPFLPTTECEVNDNCRGGNRGIGQDKVKSVIQMLQTPELELLSRRANKRRRAANHEQGTVATNNDKRATMPPIDARVGSQFTY